MNEIQYLKFRQPYERTLRQILLDLEFFLEDIKGVSIYSINHRLKTYTSASEKSKRCDWNICDLPDIAGIRIVAATHEEIDVIVRFFSRKEVSNDLEIERNEPINRDDGYRARHIIVKFKGHYSRSSSSTRVEIQLQTALENAYNFISRAWVYKSDLKYSAEWNKKFRLISENLKGIDCEISEISKEVLQNSSSRDDYELTPFSCQKIISDFFGENISIDESVDFTKWLIDRGCNTNKMLKSFFTDQKIRDQQNSLLKLGMFSNMPKYILWQMAASAHTETGVEMLDKFKSNIEGKE